MGLLTDSDCCDLCGNKGKNKAGQCEYCLWKGDIGPGKLLREKLGTVTTKVNEMANVSKRYAMWCEMNPSSTQEDRKEAYSVIYNRIVKGV